MATSDDILTQVIATKTRVEGVVLRLYGEGNDPGDIPVIRIHLEKINGKIASQDDWLQSQEIRLQVHRAKIRFNRDIVLIILAVIVSGGGISGIAKLFGLW